MSVVGGRAENICSFQTPLGAAQAEERSMMATHKIISALIAFAPAFSSAAFAENCRAIPFGPEKHACAMREHPGVFEAKQERCKQLAKDRGDTGHTATGAGGIKQFIQGCMQGKQR
jgi:hypothetical protein